MDCWSSCDVDGKVSILNFGGVLLGVQDSAGNQPVVCGGGGASSVALAAGEDRRVSGSGVGGVSDDWHDSDSSGSRLRAALPLMSSSLESSSKLLRRGRAGGGVNLQNARCQVYGCNKDLGSCKDYHKRHKVCEVHTKTAKVVVDGVEKRFCQQCSRFHLLPEFDDGKRSCRKRLAGHNARRRKPRPSLHSFGGPRKMIFPSHGIEYSMDTRPTASFIRQDMLLSHNPIWSEKFGRINGFGVSKQEPGLNCEAQSAIGILPNISCHSFDELAFFNDGKFPVAGAQFGQRPNPVLQLLLWEDKTRLQSDGVGMVDSSAWTDQGFPGSAKSTHALSLLSSQSRTSSHLTSGIPIEGSSVMHDGESPCMTRPSVMLNQHSISDGLYGVFCRPTEETRF
ncbi:hypothetical protein MLD38_031879 [Melastoma candidum]|uniref:Uncharacterized protein n=1 Tax=Melastoma candidum TaxID=119954 RepID=A0ACB9MR21_9MYRT|nr:hypothetical protein MLD38_031879 [Melastoma candidum]